MTFNSLMIHQIASVELEAIDQLNTGSYTRAMIVKDVNGNEMQVTLFSDDKSALEVKHQI